MKRVIRKICLDLHHVYHWRRLVILKEFNMIEVVDVATLSVANEKMVHDIPIDQTRTHQPKRIGLQYVLCRGGEWSALNGMPF